MVHIVFSKMARLLFSSRAGKTFDNANFPTSSNLIAVTLLSVFFRVQKPSYCRSLRSFPTAHRLWWTHGVYFALQRERRLVLQHVDGGLQTGGRLVKQSFHFGPRDGSPGVLALRQHHQRRVKLVVGKTCAR